MFILGFLRQNEENTENDGGQVGGEQRMVASQGLTASIGIGIFKAAQQIIQARITARTRCT